MTDSAENDVPSNGLREAVEALADEWELYFHDHVRQRCAADLRSVLDAHPRVTPPGETDAAE